MGKLYSVGEALIDFIALEKGSELKDVPTFEKVPGGAPANVAVAVAKLGGRSSLITKLGNDAFGDFLLDVLKQNQMETDKVLRTSEAKTALAFVSVMEDGERDFSFYRNPSADMLLLEQEIQEDWFSEGDILHFCSVDLVESPMKHANKKAIEGMKKRGGLVSFDPNIRLSLWNDYAACRRTVRSVLPYAHLEKVSDEELEFITGISQERDAIHSLFKGNYTKDMCFPSSGYPVEVADTNGAGDAFIGALLFKLLESGVRPNELVSFLKAKYDEVLTFANASGALTASVQGAIPALPTKSQVEQFLSERKILEV
ncbi:carbohydrate kinase family protein [Mesobacillus foraminis]|uniref:carbohydrate kinase family protein n=1 Tax=Mesobacillus foraminis TaxID=279826 RepID=UPI000EF43D45|nr:carbohydrate kinase [Mesobacillus foraminis]